MNTLILKGDPSLEEKITVRQNVFIDLAHYNAKSALVRWTDDGKPTSWNETLEALRSKLQQKNVDCLTETLSLPIIPAPTPEEIDEEIGGRIKDLWEVIGINIGVAAMVGALPAIGFANGMFNVYTIGLFVIFLGILLRIRSQWKKLQKYKRAL